MNFLSFCKSNSNSCNRSWLPRLLLHNKWSLFTKDRDSNLHFSSPLQKLKLKKIWTPATLTLLTDLVILVTTLKSQSQRLSLKSSMPQSIPLSSPWTSLMMRATMSQLPRASMTNYLPDPKNNKRSTKTSWKLLESLLSKTKNLPLIFHKICHQASHQTTRAETNLSKSKPKPPKNSSHKLWLKPFTSHLSNKFNKLSNNHPLLRLMSLLWWLNLLEVSSLFTKPSLQLSPLSHHPKLLSNRLLNLKLRSLTNSSSQMVDGNAASAKTITLREERSATDARSQRTLRTVKECQPTWQCLQTKEPMPRRKVSLRRKIPLKLKLQLSAKKNNAAHQRPQLTKRSKKELVTGPAKDASTTTSLSEMCATCATWATSRATNYFTDNKTKDSNKFKTWINLCHNNHTNNSKCNCQLCNNHKWAAMPQHGLQSSVTIEYYYKVFIKS